LTYSDNFLNSLAGTVWRSEFFNSDFAAEYLEIETDDDDYTTLYFSNYEVDSIEHGYDMNGTGVTDNMALFGGADYNQNVYIFVESTDSSDTLNAYIFDDGTLRTEQWSVY